MHFLLSSLFLFFLNNQTDDKDSNNYSPFFGTQSSINREKRSTGSEYFSGNLCLYTNTTEEARSNYNIFGMIVVVVLTEDGEITYRNYNSEDLQGAIAVFRDTTFISSWFKILVENKTEKINVAELNVGQPIETEPVFVYTQKTSEALLRERFISNTDLFFAAMKGPNRDRLFDLATYGVADTNSSSLMPGFVNEFNAVGCHVERNSEGGPDSFLATTGNIFKENGVILPKIFLNNKHILEGCEKFGKAIWKTDGVFLFKYEIEQGVLKIKSTKITMDAAQANKITLEGTYFYKKTDEGVIKTPVICTDIPFEYLKKVDELKTDWESIAARLRR